MALSGNETLPPPQHIAIIMDGNGRWAKQRGLPRTAGHAAGAESFRRIANYCRSLGVRYLTVYAFSTENWKRSQEEIAGIMRLLRRYLEEALQDTYLSFLLEEAVQSGKTVVSETKAWAKEER